MEPKTTIDISLTVREFCCSCPGLITAALLGLTSYVILTEYRLNEYLRKSAEKRNQIASKNNKR